MINRYFFLISLLVLATNTKTISQIIYTDIPDTTIAFPEIPYLGDSSNYFYFDLNNDSNNDYYFRLHHWQTWETPSAQPHHFVNQFNAVQPSLIAITSEGPFCAIDFNPNDTISNSLNWSYVGEIYVNIPMVDINCNLPFEDKYYGLKIQINDESHFGWVQLDANTEQITVKGYAYNSIPDMPILAGQTQAVSVDEPDLMESVFIENRNGKLLINTKTSLNLIKQITIYNLSGQVVSNKIIYDYHAELNVNYLSGGTYIIRIIFEKSTYSKILLII